MTKANTTSATPAWSEGPNGNGMPFAEFWRRASQKFDELNKEFGPWVGFPEFERCSKSFTNPNDPFDAVSVKWSPDPSKPNRTWRLSRDGTETVDGEPVSG